MPSQPHRRNARCLTLEDIFEYYQINGRKADEILRFVINGAKLEYFGSQMGEAFSHDRL